VIRYDIVVRDDDDDNNNNSVSVTINHRSPTQGKETCEKL